MAEQARITILESLTPLQARYLLLLAMKEAAAIQDRVESFHGIVCEMAALVHTWPQEECDELKNKLNLIHKAVGCSEGCKDKEAADAVS